MYEYSKISTFGYKTTESSSEKRCLKMTHFIRIEDFRCLFNSVQRNCVTNQQLLRSFLVITFKH